MDEKEDFSSFPETLEAKDREIQRLNGEVKKLEKCVRGVKVLGRALKETKKENERLRDLSNTQTQVNSEGQYADILVVDRELKPLYASNYDTGKDISEHSCQDIDDIDDIDDFLESVENNESASVCTENGNFNIKERKQNQSEKKNDKCRQVDGEGQEAEKDKCRNLNKEKDNVIKKIAASSQNNDKVLADKELKTNGKIDGIQTNVRTSQKECNENSESTEFLSDGEYVTEQDADAKQTSESEQLHVSVSVDTYDKSCEEQKDGTLKEYIALKQELKKVIKVNNDWEKFWEKQKTVMEKALEERDVIIAKLQQFKAEHEACSKTSCKTKEINATETAQKREDRTEEKTSMVKKQVNGQKDLVEQLRSELIQEQQKYERSQKLARSLLQQNKELDLEIKRLNGTLETKVEQQKSLQQHQLSTSGLNSFSSGQRHNEDDFEQKGRAKESKQMTPRDVMQPIDVKKLEQTQLLRSGLDQRRHEEQCQDDVQQYITNDADDLSTEELKERIMLLREQKNAFESDFQKERRDREAVIGQLQHVRKKLEKTRHKVKQSKYNVYQQGAFGNSPGHLGSPGPNIYVPGKCRYPPQPCQQRNQLVAHGMEDNITQDYHWYTPQNGRPIKGDPPCLCPRYHHNTP